MDTIKVPQKVFLTGANGFIARSVATKYREMGAEVCGIDFTAAPDWGVVSGDILQPENWKETLAGSDLVIHCAALVSNTCTMEDAWRVNVRGTKLVVDASIAAGVDLFVQVSSGAVYGFTYTDLMTEDAPLLPINHPYVDTKIASEHVVLAAHGSGKINCTIVRPTDIYGPGSRPWVVLPIEMLKAGKFLLPAYGRGIFSPLYIDDLVDGIILASGHEKGKGQIFNLGGNELPTCSEYFIRLARLVGKDKVTCIATPIANSLTDLLGGISRLTGKPSELGKNTMMMLARKNGLSIEKAKNLIGYAPKIDLDEGLVRVEAWLRETKLI